MNFVYFFSIYNIAFNFCFEGLKCCFLFLKSVDDFLTVNGSSSIIDIFLALHVISAINGCAVNDFLNRPQLVPLTVVEIFPLTPLLKSKTLTNGNLKKNKRTCCF